MDRYLQPLEQMMVAMEKPSQPLHASTIEILRLPKNAPPDFIEALVEKMRAVPPCPPFNQIVEGRFWQRWKTVDVDLRYHVRHVRMPPPGSMVQLMEMVEGFYGGLLNQSLPLWEAWVVEGLEEQRFALVFKGHHALADGIAGMRAYLDSLSTDAEDLRVRAPWGDNRDNTVHAKKKPIPQGQPAERKPRPSARTAVSLSATAQALWPLKTRPTRLNGTPNSSARRVGSCELSLAQIKAVGANTRATVNDVLVTLVDHATHRYLRELGESPRSPLAVLMPMSTRREGAVGGSSNQIVPVPAHLGSAELRLSERLCVVSQALARAKDAAANLPAAAQLGYTAAVGVAIPQLLQLLPGFAAGRAASTSMIVSNISPPRGAHYLDHPLYRSGARMEAFFIQPIINSGVLLNVTVTGYNQSLHAGIGSVPGAIDEPMRLGRYMVEALEELSADAAAASPQQRKTSASRNHE